MKDSSYRYLGFGSSVEQVAPVDVLEGARSLALADRQLVPSECVRPVVDVVSGVVRDCRSQWFHKCGYCAWRNVRTAVFLVARGIERVSSSALFTVTWGNVGVFSGGDGKLMPWWVVEYNRAFSRLRRNVVRRLGRAVVGRGGVFEYFQVTETQRDGARHAHIVVVDSSGVLTAEDWLEIGVELDEVSSYTGHWSKRVFTARVHVSVIGNPVRDALRVARYLVKEVGRTSRGIVDSGLYKSLSFFGGWRLGYRGRAFSYSRGWVVSVSPLLE